MNKNIEQIYKFLESKNKLQSNLIKNYISFYSEKNDYPQIFLNKRIEAKSRNIFFSEYKNMLKPNLKKSTKEIILIDGKLNAVKNLKELNISTHLTKKISNDIKFFNSDCINCDLNFEHVINNILSENSIYITVPKNLKIELPINITHIYKNRDTTTQLKTYIILEENSEIKINNYKINKYKKNSSYESINIYLKRSSKLEYFLSNTNKHESLNYFSMFSKQLKKSELSLKELYANNIISKLIYNLNIVGEEAKLKKISGKFLKNNANLDISCNIMHYSGNTQSKTIMRSITSEKAKIKFKGNINVNINTAKVISELKCNGIVLSNSSSIEFIPELSINNNDVICSHAATIGNIDKEVINYMQSRGISKKESIKTILKTFLYEIFEDDKTILEKIKKYI